MDLGEFQRWFARSTASARRAKEESMRTLGKMGDTGRVLRLGGPLFGHFKARTKIMQQGSILVVTNKAQRPQYRNSQGQKLAVVAVVGAMGSEEQR
jgi:hypothetical protein